MSNHAHVVLRNRPDVVHESSDQEVARRWWFVFPARKDAVRQPEEPIAADLQMLTADEERLAERRRRLSSLSWFMRCLAEPIARQANREDGCTGRRRLSSLSWFMRCLSEPIARRANQENGGSGWFLEGRFKCQKLLDEAAILACAFIWT